MIKPPFWWEDWLYTRMQLRFPHLTRGADVILKGCLCKTSLNSDTVQPNMAEPGIKISLKPSMQVKCIVLIDSLSGF